MEPQAQNPFMALIKKAQMQGGPQAQQMPQQPQQGMQGQQIPPSQYERGANPGNTKFLINAVQSLENYIKDSTSRDEIATARGIITLLSRLIAKDQEDMMSE